MTQDVPGLTNTYLILETQLLENIVTGFFIAEFLIKVIGQGFIIGENAYLKDNWNKFDFLIVFLSIITWFVDAYAGTNLSPTRGIRAFRAVRPLRLIRNNEGLQEIMNALI